MSNARELLTSLSRDIRDQFVAEKRVLTFSDYIDLVARDPRRQLRTSAQYIVDAIDHFGTREVVYPWGSVKRFCVFDQPWQTGDQALVGQETAAAAFVATLRSFVRDGSSRKVVLLHGPNGSAKSTMLRCLGRGLQQYSLLPEGALYRFSWIFPANSSGRGGIGFGGEVRLETVDSYATWPDDRLDARLGDELRDHPLLLLPIEARRELIKTWTRDVPDLTVGDYLLQGDLSPKNRAIYDALLASAQGNYMHVMRHVRIERFAIAQRYRCGWVTVEPQMSADAQERQVTADRSLAALPPSLQTVALYEASGELVGANRGLLEFDDLLKRPLEAFKYLLTMVERGSIALGANTLPLDVTCVGSANDIHVAAFREHPDFASFLARMEFVRVPYLRDYRQETQLVEGWLREAARGKHVAPHTAYVLALWAVLTRMRKPREDAFADELREFVRGLTPLAKAELYADGQSDAGAPPADVLPRLWEESQLGPAYEGRVGASPRELQTILLGAIERGDYVSPLVVLDEIKKLCQQHANYEFLRLEAQAGGFYDAITQIDVVRERLMDRVDSDARAALSLVDEREHGRMFARYVDHVTHAVRKEKIRNETTGKLEEPDAALMKEVETALGVASTSAAFRDKLISAIGAWAIDHPGQRPDVQQLFASHVASLKKAYYDAHRLEITQGIASLARFLRGETLPAAERPAAERATQTLWSLGYAEPSARDLIGALARARYRAA